MPENDHGDECKKTRIEMLSNFFVECYEEIGHDPLVNEVLVALLLAKSKIQEKEEK